MRAMAEGQGELQLSRPLQEAAADWLDHLAGERNYSDLTREAYGRDLRQLLSYLQAQLGRQPSLADLEILEPRTFRGFLASRRRQQASNRSLARSLSALRSFFRWLEGKEIGRNRAVLSVARPKVPHGVPKPLTVAKAAALVESGIQADSDWVVTRDTAVLLLLYGSGLRISEA